MVRVPPGTRDLHKLYEEIRQCSKPDQPDTLVEKGKIPAIKLKITLYCTTASLLHLQFYINLSAAEGKTLALSQKNILGC